MRKALVLPTIAILGGVAGFFLRRWELASVFDAETGLPAAGMQATWVLGLLSVAVLALLAVLCAGGGKTFAGGYDEAFAARGSSLYMAGMTASAFLMAIGGLLLLPALPELYQKAEQAQRGLPLFSLLPRILLAVLAVLSAASVFRLGRNGYLAEGRGRYSVWLLIPAYTACAWLIVAYQARSGDPLLLDYVYQLFAIIATVLGTYFICGFSFEKGKVFRAGFFPLAALYLIPVTLADSHEPAFFVLLVAFFLFQGTSVIIFLGNAVGGRRLASPAKFDSNREETSDEG